MIKSALNKIKSQSGETLVEMLVSLAIMGLSVAMMVAMIITSTRITEQATEKDKKYRDQLSAAEVQSTGVSGVSDVAETQWNVIIESNGGGTVTVQVEGYYYSDGSVTGELKSYKLPETTAAASSSS